MKLFLLFCGVSIINFKNIDALSCDVTPKNTEGRLLQHILCSYDKTVRPAADSLSPTLVKIRLLIKSFQYTDYDSELTINSWIALKWNDDHLKWKKSDFDNIESITLHEDEIWHPDLTIYNSPTSQYSETCTSANCVIYSTGIVSCIPPCSHTAQCKASYKYWPFDFHNCSMTFGSWVHKGEEINFQYLKSTIEESSLQHQEWKMIRVQAKKHTGNYSCCPDATYPSLQYSFIIQRHSASEEAYILGPAIILACLNLMILWLSPSCVERVIVSTVSLIGHFLFIQSIAWQAPKNGAEVPNAVLYFRDSLIISAALLLDTILMKALLTCKRRTPEWLKTSTNYLRGHKVGQLMFSNPYIITGTSLNNDSGNNDEENLVESQLENVETAQTTQETVSKKSESKLWPIIVRILDAILFIILTISYLIMIFGWIPETSGDWERNFDITK